MNMGTDHKGLTTRKKVLHLASGDLWAGAEAQVYQLVCAHRKTGRISAAVIVLNDGELARRLLAAGVEVFIVPEAHLHPLPLLLRVIRIAKHWKPDVIHTHRFKENILGAIAARLLAVPLLRTQHGLPEGAGNATKRASLANRLDQLAARLYSCTIVSVSPPTLEYAERAFPTARHLLIANGVQNELTTQMPARVPDGVLRVGLCGRLVAVKRVDLFLHMARKLVDRNKFRYAFLVIGDGPLLGAMQQLLVNLDLQHCCRFIGHRSDATLELAGLDVLTITSDHEGLPMVALEALTVGTPVVARAVGGLPRLLSRPELGQTLDSADPVALAAAVEQQLALLQVSRPNAHASLLPADYDIAVTAGQYEAAYTAYPDILSRTHA
jgi:glycosyltransferase involved in cell wall biosynthesis